MSLNEYNSTNEYWLRDNTSLDGYQTGYKTADGFGKVPGTLMDF